MNNDAVSLIRQESTIIRQGGGEKSGEAVGLAKTRTVNKRGASEEKVLFQIALQEEHRRA